MTAATFSRLAPYGSWGEFEQQARPLSNACDDLPVQGIAQVVPRQRSDLRPMLERVAHLGLAHQLDKPFLESWSDLFGHNEAFGGNAALARI